MWKRYLILQSCLKTIKGILWEIYDHCSEVLSHVGRKFSTVLSGQNYQKCPQKSNYLVPRGKKCDAGGQKGVVPPFLPPSWYNIVWYFFIPGALFVWPFWPLWPIPHFISICNKTSSLISQTIPVSLSLTDKLKIQSTSWQLIRLVLIVHYNAEIPMKEPTHHQVQKRLGGSGGNLVS